MSNSEPKVAIACQGGGSHTAFTAGALRRLLETPDLDADIIGLSGTSGGAMCALLGWYGRVHPEESPDDLLTQFWADLSARQPADRFINDSMQWRIGMARMGFPMPETSPYYTPGTRLGQQHLQKLLERHIDFEAIPDLIDESTPALLISAINVLSGEFHIFREHDLSPPALLASAAEPGLFEAVEHDGDHYWDGLFSKNPPLMDFMTIDGVPDPDEIWLIKINPQERSHIPKTPDGIADRRNELSGNLSMNGELRFVRQVNEWIEKGYLPDRYTHTEIKRIRFRRQGLDWRTKLDRSPEFIEKLIGDGTKAAEEFLDERAEQSTASQPQ